MGSCRGVSRGGAAAARARGHVALLLPPPRRAARAARPRARPRSRLTPAHAVTSNPTRHRLARKQTNCHRDLYYLCSQGLQRAQQLRGRGCR